MPISKQHTKKIKLSEGQKKVIMAMRIKEGVFRWVGMPHCKFSLQGKTFRYDLGTDLQDRGLIETAGGVNSFYRPFTLTELGKSIDI